MLINNCEDKNQGKVDTSKPEIVSVVIPAFNHAAFLSAAIKSVLGQSDSSYELIVVDDGSTDDTRAVVARYRQVRYVYQENRGLSAARNAGLRLSIGAFVVFLDADDILEPQALAVGRANLVAHPDWAFVSGAHRRVDTELRPIGPDYCCPVHSEHYKAL